MIQPAYKKVIVQAPASTSNLGPGFDILGLALDVMFDIVEVTWVDEKSISIEMEGVGSDIIPTNPQKNSAGRTALEFIKGLDKGGFKIKITKGIPPGSGLGSSGASAAATAVAINHLLGLELNKRKLTEIAAQGEIASAGAPHADNVAPSIYGGWVLIGSYNPLEILAFPPPKGMEFALAIPKGMKKTTEKARSVLPKNVTLSMHISNLGAASIVVAGLLQSDPKLVGKGMLGDQIIEPARTPLYPGFMGAKEAGLSAGAFGVTLSGAGPTVIAVTDNRKKAIEIAKAMKEAFVAKGIECDTYTSHATTGAKVIRTVE